MLKSFDLYCGEPGTAKSYTLVQQALMDARLGRGSNIYIMTPTQASKQNLISMFDKLKKEANDHANLSDAKLLEDLKWTVHVMDGRYQTQQYVYIDEFGQLPSTYFNSLLLNMQSASDVVLKAFGDIKQLTPPTGNSPVEALMRNNLETEDLWSFVADKCYDDFYFETMTAPKMWQIDIDITVHLLNENYRLKKLGYTSFNNDFFDSIIKQVTQKDDYEEELMQAVNDYNLILVATKSRGREIDDLFEEKLSLEEYQGYAPFIEYNNKTYLNPWNKEYKTLQSKFSGVPTIEKPEQLSHRDVSFKYWATVHSTQGVTVSAVTFYMGNKPISNGHKNHYSSNLFYTSITRASDSIQLLGLAESFKEMRHIQPITPQKKLQHILADEAGNKLLEKLYKLESPVPYTFPQLRDMYDDIYKHLKPSNNLEHDLSDFNVTLMPYTDNELKLKFKDWDGSIGKGFGKPNYGKLIYEKYFNEVKVNNRKGRGKVQIWLSGLTADEIEAVKQDVNALSVRKFKDKYNMAKKNVVKALSEQEVAK